MRVIVFDVDNTVLRGHLIRLFLYGLLKQHPLFASKFLPFIGKNSVAFGYTLPRLIKSLVYNKQFDVIDTLLRESVQQFYRELWQLLSKLGIHSKNLAIKAHEILFAHGLMDKVYPEALKLIAHWLRLPDTLVVLMSATLHDLVQPLFNEICRSFQKEGISTERLLLQGSLLDWPTGSMRVCIGHEKIRYLEEIMRLHAVLDGFLEYVYTDNGLFADLPLLSQAQNGVIIGHHSSLYNFVSDKVLKSSVFSPQWGRKS